MREVVLQVALPAGIGRRGGRQLLCAYASVARCSAGKKAGRQVRRDGVEAARAAGEKVARCGGAYTANARVRAAGAAPHGSEEEG